MNDIDIAEVTLTEGGRIRNRSREDRRRLERWMPSDGLPTPPPKILTNSNSHNYKYTNTNTPNKVGQETAK